MMPEFLHCVECGREWEVSEEDADATLSDAMAHMRAHHPAASPYKTIKEGRAKA